MPERNQHRRANTPATPFHELASATHEERTRLLYEDVPGCPHPPFFDATALDNLKSFEPLGVLLNRCSEGILKVALRMTGVGNLQKDTSAIERLLRTVNLRNNYFAPVMSATAAIEEHPSSIEPLNRAAALLVAAKAMHRDLLAGCFPPDRYGGGVLETGQYLNLFSTHIIHEGKRFRVYKSTCTSQVTVLSAGQFYSLDFRTLEDTWTASDVLTGLFHIRALASKSEAPRALISAAKPEIQAKAWIDLLNHPTGAQSLSTLRHSFATLCLDLDHAPSSAAEAAALAHSGNYANRWYNAALQIVVFGNSTACLIFNFNAYLDGNVQMRAASEIWRRSISVEFEPASRDILQAAVSVREILLPVSPALLDRARKDIAGVSHNQQSTFEVAGYGRSFFSSRDLDPVAAFVAALQLAVFRLTGRIARIRQLLTMSKYRYTDLVTASVTTRQMERFLRCMQDPAASRQEKRERLQAAIDSQIATCRNARRYFPAFRLQMLLAGSRPWIYGIYIRAVIKATKLLLQVMGLSHFGHEDILISHPQIYDEVLVVGRPGVRLPYLRFFGLHYQIWERSIVLTWMPAKKWKIANVDLTKELIQSLREIADITTE